MKTLLTTRSLYKIPAASNTEQKNKREIKVNKTALNNNKNTIQ